MTSKTVNHTFFLRKMKALFFIAFNQLRKKKTLLLKSLNTFFEPYEIHVSEVKEVWKFCNYISSEIPNATVHGKEFKSVIEKMEVDLAELKKKAEVFE